MLKNPFRKIRVFFCSLIYCIENFLLGVSVMVARVNYTLTNYPWQQWRCQELLRNSDAKV